MRVKITIPKELGYPWRETELGLKNTGLEVISPNFSGSEILVTWSPWLGTVRESEARRHRVVIVMENGWFSPLGAGPFYQVSLWGWNGQGCYLPGPAGRLQRFGLPEPRPLNDPNGPWLVVEQRGGASGNDPRSMPNGWAEKARERLLKTEHRVFVHRKGGTEGPVEVFERLRPRAVVTWGSTFASWALWHSVPVFYAGPSIAAWRAAKRWNENEPAPRPKPLDMDKVVEVFNDLAWSQWTATEIASGEPFRRLLNLS